MNINTSARARNYTFLFFTALTIIFLYIAHLAAIDRNKALLAEYQEYMTAKTLITQKDFNNAEKILTKFTVMYPQSFEVLWTYGLCIAQNGNLVKGAEYMEKAIELAPVIITFPKYLMEFGCVLFELGNYERAEKYFHEIKKYNPTAELNTTVDQYLEKIQKLKNN